jgi:hypothetical protein
LELIPQDRKHRILQQKHMSHEDLHNKRSRRGGDVTWEHHGDLITEAEHGEKTHQMISGQVNKLPLMSYLPSALLAGHADLYPAFLSFEEVWQDSRIQILDIPLAD